MIANALKKGEKSFFALQFRGVVLNLEKDLI